MDLLNLKQQIEHYEGLTGIKTRPPHANDQQYLDFLIAQTKIEEERVSAPKIKKKKKKVWGE